MRRGNLQENPDQVCTPWVNSSFLHPGALLLSQAAAEKATWFRREGRARQAKQSRLPASFPEVSSMPAHTQAAAEVHERILAPIQLQFWLPIPIL